MKEKRRFYRIILVILAAALTAGTAASALAAENYLELNGEIPDRSVYSGPWPEAYRRILADHAGGIRRYQSHRIEFNDYVIPCRPVGLQDLTGDGIPELLFLEADGAEQRGDLYIYTGDETSARCMLYLPGITRLDYDDMLGFDIFLTAAGGESLVIRHYEYETPWILQFSRNALDQYTLTSWMNVEADFSGEGEDTFYRNGRVISEAEYYAASDEMISARIQTVSSYFEDNYRYFGLSETIESAAEKLGGELPETVTAAPVLTPEPAAEVYGYTIDKLATRKGPGTQYEGGGTYSVQNQWIKVVAKAWDKRNNIWWVKCEIPYRNEIRVLWTGYKRFDPESLDLGLLPEENWD